MNQDESVLADVLKELDKERGKRAELEAKLQVIAKQETQTTSTHPNDIAMPPPLSNIHKNNNEEEDHQDFDCFEEIIQGHKIDTIITEYKSKSSPRNSLSQSNLQRHLGPLLTPLLNTLHDSILEQEVEDNTTKKTFLQSREKRVKRITTKILAECKRKNASRFLRKETGEDDLRSILKSAIPQYIASLKKIKEGGGGGGQHVVDDTSSIGDMAASSSNAGLRGELISVRTERDGFLDIIDVLTSGNPAITMAAKGTKGSLPLHIVRYLELMPWEKNAQDFASAYDEVHQWQVYDVKAKDWSDKVKMFPQQFSALRQNSMEGLASSETSPVKKLQRVFDPVPINGLLLTNSTCTEILDLTNGYPLPSTGTWEWVGNWTLKLMSNDCCDDEGWTYANKINSLVTWKRDEFFRSRGTLNKYRRRIYHRQRALLSYHGISERTRQILLMNAHNAKLSLSVSKLNEQINSMQNKLMEKEEEIDKKTMELIAQKKTIKELELTKMKKKDPLDQSRRKEIKSSNEKNKEEKRAPLLALSDISITKNSNSQRSDDQESCETICKKEYEASKEEHMSTIVSLTTNQSEEIKPINPTIDSIMESVRSNVQNFSEKVSTFQNIRPFTEQKARSSESEESSKANLDGEVGKDKNRAMNLKLIRMG